MYIGKTNDLKKRWLDHLRVSKGGKEKYHRKYSIIHKAISKYKESNFTFTVIQSFAEEKHAYEAEVYWIKYFNSTSNDFGYNVSLGGAGIGSGINNPSFGKKRSDETKRKLRDSHLGEKNSNYKKVFSEETLLKMSRSQKGKQLGENHANSILTWEIVDKIRFLYANGISITNLSKQFNTHRTNIYAIVKFRTWIKKS